jgi:hypothetical protein
MALPVTAAELRAQTPVSGDIDTGVKIPRAVVEAGKRSEALQRASIGEAEPSVAEAIEKAKGAVETPPGEPQPAEVRPPSVTPPGNGAAPTEPPPPAEPPPAEGEPVDWEQRYKRLQGRHEADARRNRDQMQILSDRLDRVEHENQTLRSAAPPPPSNEPPAPLLTEAEIADYGPEFVDVMRRLVTEATAPLNQEIGRLRAGLGHVQVETGNAFLTRMNATIAAAVPTWDQLNKDERFIAWSQLPDIFSGGIRSKLMQEAWNSGDAQRVIAFFQAFLAEEAALHPPGGNGQARTVPRTVVGDQSILPPPAAPAAPGLDLANLAAPGRAHSAGGTPAEKPVYTTVEITRFYTDVASGKWRGREAQQAAIDADIILAQREGRIIINPRTQLPRDAFSR